MLHSQMQRQVHLPETDRPRVPLLVDEAHYVAGAENVVDQIATHRRGRPGDQLWPAVLRPARLWLPTRGEDPQGRAQPAAEPLPVPDGRRAGRRRGHQDRDGRLLDDDPRRPGLPRPAAGHARASAQLPQPLLPGLVDRRWARASRASWARPTPSRRTPTRGPSITSPIWPRASPPTPTISSPRSTAQPCARPGIATIATRRQARTERVTRAAVVSRAGARRRRASGQPHLDRRSDRQTGGARQRPRPTHRRQPTTRQSSHRGLPSRARASTRYRSTTRRPPPRRTSPTAPCAGSWDAKHPRAPRRARDDAAAPDSLRELAFLDRVNEIGPPQQLDGAAKLPRMFDEDYAILALLDRAGLAPRSLIGRAVLPGRGANAVISRLTKLYRHGLIAQHTIGIREHSRTDGRPPLLYSITRRGLEVAQARNPAPAISPKREWRPIEQRRAARLPHDLHALGWAIELHRTVGPLATDRWRTPRYATGRYPVPQVGSGQRRHPITLNEISVPDGQAIIDVELKTFSEVKPDLSLELRIDSLKLTFDLLVELDLTARPSYNRDKLLAYDAFLCGWSLAHPRFRTQGTRPAVVFVCPDRPRRAGVRSRGRRSSDRPHRRHGHPGRTLVLRRPRPPVLRRRVRHPPRRPFRTCPPTAPAQPPGTTCRSARPRANGGRAPARPGRRGSTQRRSDALSGHHLGPRPLLPRVRRGRAPLTDGSGHPILAFCKIAGSSAGRPFRSGIDRPR